MHQPVFAGWRRSGAGTIAMMVGTQLHLVSACRPGSNRITPYDWGRDSVTLNELAWHLLMKCGLTQAQAHELAPNLAGEVLAHLGDSWILTCEELRAWAEDQILWELSPLTINHE
jgi:hypothetical protein